MFAIIYNFEAKEGKEEEFEKAWREMTELIYAAAGSLGSRLHIEGHRRYIAYAQWPDRETWEKSGASLPESADPIRKKMGESCHKIEILHQLEMVDDFLWFTPKN